MVLFQWIKNENYVHVSIKNNKLDVWACLMNNESQPEYCIVETVYLPIDSIILLKMYTSEI